MRNPKTLEAYRQHMRAVRGAAQPWITLAPILAALMALLTAYALFNDGFRRAYMFLVFPGLMAGCGLASVIAGLRMARYRRDHPLRLPEA
jgi:hypothetical protein